MANKIPWYITLDWKNITGLLSIIAIIGIVVFLVVLPNILQSKRVSKYHGEVRGVITSVTENTEIDHGFEGTKIYVGSYTVNYFYQVNGKSYTGVEHVKARPNTTRILNTITASESKQLVVKYDEANPERSTILID